MRGFFLSIESLQNYTLLHTYKTQVLKNKEKYIRCYIMVRGFGLASMVFILPFCDKENMEMGTNNLYVWL